MNVSNKHHPNVNSSGLLLALSTPVALVNRAGTFLTVNSALQRLVALETGSQWSDSFEDEMELWPDVGQCAMWSTRHCEGGVFDIRVTTLEVDQALLEVSAKAVEPDLASSSIPSTSAKGSERNFRTLFETTGASTILCEEDMTILFANEQFSRMCGYSKDELEGRRRALDFIHPEDLPLVVSHMSRRRAGDAGVPKSYELRGVRRDGRVINIWMTVGLIPGTKRSINSLIDITNLKTTEAALNHRIKMEVVLNQITRNFINIAPEDFDEQLNHVLPEIATHYGGDRVQILEFQDDYTLLSCTMEWCGEGVISTIREFDCFSIEPVQAWLEAAREHRHYMARVGELGESEQAQANFLAAYGCQSILVVPLIIDGQPHGLLRVDALKEPAVWSELDIHLLETVAAVIATARGSIDSELRQQVIEEQMRQAQKLESLGVLAGGIAHDFNNILTAIIGYCDLATIDNDDPEDIQECIMEVKGSAGRAKDLVSHILTFSRKSILTRTPVSMQRVVEDALTMFRACVPALITIDYDVRCKACVVSADSIQMHQVVMNLCTNAFHAMGGAGILSIRLKNRQLHTTTPWGNMHMAPGTYVELVISDSGSGMPPEVLERVFDPFFTTKGPGEGTGMGLSTVHGIVSDHGGGITVTSKAEIGTTFQILLPLCAEEERDPRVTQLSTPIPISVDQKQIMVVDDEMKIRNLQERLLHKMGYDVTLFKNAVEALAVFSNRPHGYDLIISDWAMPEMNGAEFATRVKTIREDIPIILCTGFSEIVYDTDHRQAEIFEILAKPFVKEDLASLIDRALRFP